MKQLFSAILSLYIIVSTVYAQNITSVLRAIENYEVFQLSNGFKIQVINTKEYKYCNCRISADVSNLNEGSTVGIKQVVATMIGGDLVANDVIVKNMIAHDKALDSLLQFMSETLYGNDPKYINFADYKEKRIRYLRNNGETLDMLACKAIHLQYVTAESLSQISNTDFSLFRSQCFSPERCLLTIVSDMKSEEVKQLAEKYFGTQSKSTTKLKTPPSNVIPIDEVKLLDDTTLNTYQAVYKHYYPCDKNTKSYILNKLAFNMMFEKYMSQTNGLSCFKYDVNTLSIEGPSSEFGPMSQAIYAPRKPDFKNEPALNVAKKSVITEFKTKLKMPDYAAELASALILYKFPNNYFTAFENAVNSVTTTEAQQFLAEINKKGSSILIVKGPHKDLHCDLMALSSERDISITNPINPSLELRINKGFCAKVIIDNYLSTVGLDNPPKNMIANFSSVYTYPNGDKYHAVGRIMRKLPNNYMLENYILHSDSIRVFHYREMFDGITGVDSTMLYGMEMATPTRAQVLRQKATYPQEAHYEELGMTARYKCDYNDFKKGLMRITVTEASGQIYHDYYSIASKLRTHTDILNVQGQKVKTITYQYEPYDKYNLLKVVTEKTDKLTIEITFDSYDLNTTLKKTDFQIEQPSNTEKKKKKQ